MNKKDLASAVTGFLTMSFLLYEGVSDDEIKKLTGLTREQATERYYNDLLPLVQKILKNKDSITDKENELQWAFDYVTKVIANDKRLSKPIIKQKYKKPDNFVQSTTKVNSKLFDGGRTDFLTAIQPLNVGAHNKPALVDCFISAVDESLEIKHLTPFDREVFNGICSILDNGQKTMTAPQIYEAMTGKPAKNKETLNDVVNSINKMMSTKLEIDWTEQAKQNKKIDLDEVDFLRTRDWIIKPAEILISTHGKLTEGYMFDSEPILYRYAKITNQIASTQRKIIQIDSISATKDNVVMKNYLVRHVERCKHNSKHNRTLTFETFFRNCCIAGDKTTMSRKRKTVFAILDYWKEIDYIKDYEVEKKKGAFYSFTIKI